MGSIVGCESLIRWHHPDHSIMGPSSFIEGIGRSGAIVEVGYWSLQKAAQQLADWHRQGFQAQPLNTNLSPRQFNDRNLPCTLQKVLSDSQIPPHLLELEFSESTACVDVELALSITEQIYNLGPRLCIDAFSTGLSSLKYLQQMPVDTLKIDCSVVQEIGVNAGGEMITDAIIALARCMELNVVAEGVETEQQLEFLNARGCCIIQGFYYSRPLSTPDFQNLLRTDTPPFCASPSADPVRSISIAS